MLAALNAAPAGTIVVLHACCHNPTGYDLTADAVDAGHRRGQGARARALPRHGLPGLRRRHRRGRRGRRACSSTPASTSSSRPRSRRASRCTASASARCQRRLRQRKDEADARAVQLKRVIRTNYSNPPTHGAQVVATVLTTPALRALWEEELAGMRERIKQMRVALRRQARRPPASKQRHELHHRGRAACSATRA